MTFLKTSLGAVLLLSSFGAFADSSAATMSPTEKAEKIQQFCGIYGSLGEKAMEARKEGLTFEQTSYAVSTGVSIRAEEDKRAHPERKEEYEKLQTMVLTIARGALMETYSEPVQNPSTWRQKLINSCVTKMTK